MAENCKGAGQSMFPKVSIAIPEEFESPQLHRVTAGLICTINPALCTNRHTMTT